MGKKSRRNRNNSPARIQERPVDHVQDFDGGVLPPTVGEVRTARYTWAGPLPPPQVLQQYNEIVPGAAERLIAMAEAQQEHRHGLENRVVNGNLAAQSRGQWIAAAIVLLTIAGGFWLALNDKSAEGLATVITAIGGAVGVFIYGSRRQVQELAKKRANEILRAQRQSDPAQLSLLSGE